MSTQPKKLNVADRVVVINLKRSADRWESFPLRWKNGGFTKSLPTRVDAVDGRKVDRKSMSIDSYRSMKRGEIGCWLSHRKAWTKAVAKGTNLMVCEDDVDLKPDFLESFNRVKKTLPADWEVASFVATPLWRRKYQDSVGKSEQVNDDWLRVHGDCYGTMCYMINQSVIDRLLRSETMTAPIDVELSRLTRFYVVTKNIVGVRKMGSTTQRS